MNDAEKQYKHWLAVRGCGIKRAARKTINRRDTAKRNAQPLRRERAKKFKWLMLTGGSNPPLRHRFGIP